MKSKSASLKPTNIQAQKERAPGTATSDLGFSSIRFNRAPVDKFDKDGRTGVFTRI
jgi:hypothetical protein